MDVFEAAAAALRRGERCVMVTVIEHEGSTPREAGARMLVRADGSIAGTVGGGRLEHLVVQDALATLAAWKREAAPERPRVVEYRLSADLAMCCGGVMRLFVEPLEPPPQLVIFGAGHVGLAVAHAAAPLGLRTWVVDDNEDLCNRARFPESIAPGGLVTSFAPSDFERDLPLDGAYAVITTREHRIDQELLLALVDKPLRYLGLIGSRTKIEKFRQRLLARGLSAEALARVHMPVGLSIGAETPEEIAVSVIAEIIAVRRAVPETASGRPMAETAEKPGAKRARRAASADEDA